MSDLAGPQEKVAAGGKPFIIEPIHVTIPVACQITGDSRTKLYDAIGRGEVEAVKEGARTLVVYASLKRRAAARPRALIGAGNSTTEKFRELRKLPRQKRRKGKGS